MTVIFPPVLIAGSIPSIDHTDKELKVVGGSVHTYTGKSIGTASPRRLVGVIAGCVSTSATVTATLDGAAMTDVGGGASYNGGNFRSRVFTLAVAAGTTAEIELTTAGVFGSSSIAIFAIYDLRSSTPHDSASGIASGTTLTLDVDVPSRGVACGHAFVNFTDTATWTGLVEDFDVTASSNSHSGASYTAVAAQSPLSITQVGAAFGWRGSAVSFR